MSGSRSLPGRTSGSAPRSRRSPKDAWQPIPYWLSTPEVSGADVADVADVAETSYTVFATDKRHARTVRLVVRRVRPTPGSQLALFTPWDYHAFVTDRAGDVLEIEADHRRHAVVEQSIAELKSAGLAHMPSGNFMANAAWLALTVMAHNLGRAVGHLAGPTCTPRPPRPCGARSSPCPAGSCTAADGDIYDYLHAGPGPRPSAPHSPRSTRSRCAADPPIPPRR